jgi:rare lipoprotein A
MGDSIETVLVQPRSYKVGHFSVQVGSFKDRENAEALAKNMKKKYGASFVQKFDRGDAVFYRVQVGDRPTLKEAEKLQEKLEGDGFRDSFVVAR